MRVGRQYCVSSGLVDRGCHRLRAVIDDTTDRRPPGARRPGGDNRQGAGILARGRILQGVQAGVRSLADEVVFIKSWFYCQNILQSTVGHNCGRNHKCCFYTTFYLSTLPVSFIYIF